MTHPWKTALTIAAGIAVIGGAAVAQDRHDQGRRDQGQRDEGRGGGNPAAAPRQAAPRQATPRQAEPHQGPRGYNRPSEPAGWNARPQSIDRGAYQHNFQAARQYRIGPYHAPRGWAYRQWGYGQILPRAYWGSQYILGDYWLFGLEVPPIGYEWVRSGSDALLIDVNSGQILQVEYGVFA